MTEYFQLLDFQKSIIKKLVFWLLLELKKNINIVKFNENRMQ